MLLVGVRAWALITGMESVIDTIAELMSEDDSTKRQILVAASVR
jgi:hypothetical protein